MTKQNELVFVEQDSTVYDGSKRDKEHLENLQMVRDEKKRELLDAIENKVSIAEFEELEQVYNKYERICQQIEAQKVAYEEQKTLRRMETIQRKARMKTEVVKVKVTQDKLVTRTTEHDRFVKLIDECPRTLFATKPQLDKIQSKMSKALEKFTQWNQLYDFVKDLAELNKIKRERAKKDKKSLLPEQKNESYSMSRMFIQEFLNLNSKTKLNKVNHAKVIRYYNYSKSPCTTLLMHCISKLLPNIATYENRTFKIKGVTAISYKTQDEIQALLNEPITTRVVEDGAVKVIDTGKKWGRKNPKLYEHEYTRELGYCARFIKDNAFKFRKDIKTEFETEVKGGTKDTLTADHNSPKVKQLNKTTATFNTIATQKQIEGQYDCLKAYQYKFTGKEHMISSYRWKTLAQNIITKRARQIDELKKEKDIDFLFFKNMAVKLGVDVDERACNSKYDRAIAKLSSRNDTKKQLSMIKEFPNDKIIQDRFKKYAEGIFAVKPIEQPLNKEEIVLDITGC